jgi:hypothetical protein
MKLSWWDDNAPDYPSVERLEEMKKQQDSNGYQKQLSFRDISESDRIMVNLLCKEYTSGGWPSKIFVIPSPWDKFTQGYVVQSHSGRIFRIQLQKYHGGFLRKQLWMIMLSEELEEQEKPHLLGYGIERGLANSLAKAERFMVGTPPDFDNFDTALIAMQRIA